MAAAVRALAVHSRSPVANMDVEEFTAVVATVQLTIAAGIETNISCFNQLEIVCPGKFQ